MFGMFKRDPKTRLQREYETKMREARDLQRAGDIVGFAAKMAEAEAVRIQLDALGSGHLKE